jgi:hypothetical protein
VDDTGPGTLKSVSAWSPDRPLADAIERRLREHVPDHNVARLHGDTLIVFTEASTDAVRDWLAPLLRDGESLLVAEFEHWSSWGAAIDSAWLLRRGH